MRHGQMLQGHSASELPYRREGVLGSGTLTKTGEIELVYRENCLVEERHGH